MTPDAAVVRDFYNGLLGWNLKASPKYTEVSVGPVGVGGMLQIWRDAADDVRHDGHATELGAILCGPRLRRDGGEGEIAGAGLCGGRPTFRISAALRYLPISALIGCGLCLGVVSGGGESSGKGDEDCGGQNSATHMSSPLFESFVGNEETIVVLASRNLLGVDRHLR